MPAELLRSATRLVIAVPGRDGPVATPMAFWFDGASLWMTTSASSAKARLLARSRRCALWVPPREAGRRGVAVEGPARVFSAADPVGLLTHWATISAAVTALLVKQSSTLGGYVRDLPQMPLRWLPPGRVVVRVRAERLRAMLPPEPGPGIAPALPGVVPSDIRRILSGRRDVAVAAQLDGVVALRPAAWGAGFALDLGDEPAWSPGTPVTAVLDDDPLQRPSDVVGIALHGHLDARGAIRPQRVSWWHGYESQRAEVPSRAAGAVVLPE